ncbi:MAG: LysR family transcriptional regulator [Eggerthellaceae bacterium]
MNLDHLYYFKTLVETNSRTEAASKLAVTPSTLSLAISKLERELNVTLIDKKRKSVDLTTDGQAFYEYIATALRFIDRGVNILQERHGGSPQGEITIGTVFSVQDNDWSNITSQFRERTHGEVRINVKQSTTPALLEDMKNGVVDVAFCGTMGDDFEIVFDPIWTQRAALVVNRRHPLAKRTELSLTELQNQYLISYNLTGPLASELTDLVKGYDLLIDYLYSDEITLASLVAGNPDLIAIACRSWLLDSYTNEVKLIDIKEAPDDFHQLYLCSLQHVRQSHTTALFVDTVKRYCAERTAQRRSFKF